MSTGLTQLTTLLRALYPSLSKLECKLLATQFLGIVDRAVAEEWHILQLQLTPRNGRKASPLGAELKQLRLDADMTQAGVAKIAEWSMAKVSRIESGEVGISNTDLLFLLDLYKVTDSAARDRLKQMRGS